MVSEALGFEVDEKHEFVGAAVVVEVVKLPGDFGMAFDGY